MWACSPSLFACCWGRGLWIALEEQSCLLLVRISLFAECINFQHFLSVDHPDKLLVSSKCADGEQWRKAAITTTNKPTSQERDTQRWNKRSSHELPVESTRPLSGLNSYRASILWVVGDSFVLLGLRRLHRVAPKECGIFNIKIDFYSVLVFHDLQTHLENWNQTKLQKL